MLKYKICVGLDLSMAKTGFSLFTKTGIHMGSGVIKSPSKGYQGIRRIIRFEKMCRDLFSMLILLSSKKQLKKALFIIESYAFNKGPGQGMIMNIAEFGGLVRYYLHRNLRIDVSKQILECPPQWPKMFACGAGHAKKDMVMKDTFKRWGFEGEDDNEVDAYVMSRIGMEMIGGSGDKLIAKQLEVLEKARDKMEEQNG